MTENANNANPDLGREYLDYLDDLKMEGFTNMLAMRVNLIKEYPHLTKTGANALIGHWVRTYRERHPNEEQETV